MKTNPNIVAKNVSIDAWASPEGELSKNENLADDRAKSAKTWAKGELVRAKNDSAKGRCVLHPEPTRRGLGRVQARHASQQHRARQGARAACAGDVPRPVAKREEEIKNMAATYKEIADRDPAPASPQRGEAELPARRQDGCPAHRDEPHHAR
jgi:hypothetical protein